MQVLSKIPVWLITSTDDMSFSESAANAGEDVAQNVAFIQGLGYNIVAFQDNDGLNGFLRGQDAVNDVQRVVDAAAAADCKMIVSTFKVGTVLPAAHWSWMSATDNAAVRDWLFGQVNDAPYAGE